MKKLLQATIVTILIIVVAYCLASKGNNIYKNAPGVDKVKIVKMINGDLWCAGDKNIYKLSSSGDILSKIKMPKYSQPDEYLYNFYVGKQYICVGTLFNIYLSEIKSGKWKAYQLVEGFHAVSGTVIDSNADIWVALQGGEESEGGLFKYDRTGDRFQNVDKLFGTASNDMSWASAIYDAGKNLVIGSKGKIIKYSLESRTAEELNVPDQFREKSSLAITGDNKYLWIGAQSFNNEPHYLFQYEKANAKWRSYKDGSTPRFREISNICSDGSHVYFISHDLLPKKGSPDVKHIPLGLSIISINDGKIYDLADLGIFKIKQIYSLAIDADNLWLAADKGLLKVKKAQLIKEILPREK